MNNDELQAHIAAIEEALRNGEIEEAHLTGEYGEPKGGTVIIGDTGFTYKIKSKPLECWVLTNVAGDGDLDDTVWLRPQAAEEQRLSSQRVVHMREVTE